MAATALGRALFVFLVCAGAKADDTYSVPEVTIQAFKPKGFRASIPDAPNLALFVFQGNVNRNIESTQVGELHGEVTTPTNGRWVVELPDVTLAVGDVIKYHVFASVKSAAYLKDKLTFTVTKLEDYAPVVPTTTSPPGCAPTLTRVRGGNACAGQTIFEDHFDSLRTHIWQVQHYIPVDHPENPFVSYQRSAVSVQNGNLRIVSSLQQNQPGFTADSMFGSLDLNKGCTSETSSACFVKADDGSGIIPPVVGCRITSKAGFAFTYGTVTVRAKLPQGDWLYPEILLEPLMKKFVYGSVNSGVVKIACSRGNKELNAGSTQYGNKVKFVYENGTRADVGNDPNYKPENPLPTQTPTNAPQPTQPSVCQPTATIVQGKTVCKGDLIFSEEFDKTAVKDLSLWDAENKFPDEPDYPFNVYMTRDTMELENGQLVISPKLLDTMYHDGFVQESLDLSDICTGTIDTAQCKRVASGADILPPVMTGKITTKHKFNFKFGRVEVKAKLPAGSWLIPEINLEPRENFYGYRRYESGLIRVAFVKGNAEFAKKLYGGPLLSDTDPFRSQLMKTKIGIENWCNGFHNYTMIWKPDGMVMMVDGEEYGKIDPGEGFYAAARQAAVPHAGNWLRGSSVMAPLDQLFYISLGLRVGGVHDFADTADKPWKNKNNKAVLKFWEAKDTWFPSWHDANLKIESVKVYAL